MKVALVDYLNAAPLWWGLSAGHRPPDWELCFETPARCAQMMRSGEAGVGILPSLEFDAIPDLCMPAPLGVACSGEVRSVLLFAGGAPAGMRRVLLDPASRTSQALVKILLRTRVADPPLFVEEFWQGGSIGEDEAALVIGDRSLRLRRERGDLAAMDLGRAWFEETGLPFVFAVWASRKLPQEESVAEALLASYLYGSEHLEEIVAEYAPRVGLAPEEVREYLTVNLHHALRDEDYDGLRLFWQRASLDPRPEEPGASGPAPA